MGRKWKTFQIMEILPPKKSYEAEENCCIAHQAELHALKQTSADTIKQLESEIQRLRAKMDRKLGIAKLYLTGTSS